MKLSGVRTSLSKRLDSLKETGFFHIFGASTINKILGVVLSFVLVRILPQAEYGVYAYALNIANYFLILNGLGVVSAILQICSEEHKDEIKANSFFVYGYKWGAIVDCFIAGGMLFISIFVSLAIPESNTILSLLCLYPLSVLLFTIKVTRLRVQLNNRDYAISTVTQTVLMVIFSLVGVLTFQAAGLVVGQIASYFIAYLIMCVRFPFKGINRQPLDEQEKTNFWKISIISAITEGLSQALSLIGTFLTGLLLASDTLVAIYQASTMIPFGLLFIPSAIVTYIYPYFARNKNDANWTRANYKKLTMYTFVGMAAITLAICLLAEPIVLFIFGEPYREAIPILRILMIAFLVASTFRQIPGNLLVTQWKLKTNTVIALISIIVNVLSSLLLIPNFGVYGAAWSYVLTIGFNSMLSTGMYIRTIRNL